MGEKQKSQRGFVAVTLITVLAIATVLIVYAAILGTIPGGEVTVGGVGGSISYSSDNSTWASTLSVSGTSTPWYAKLTTTSGGYIGPVTISWQLTQKQTNGTYTNLGSTTSTSYTLNGAAQTIYVTSTGINLNNRDWSQTAGYTTGSYKVVATVSSTG
jgi:hypothetical protein